LSNLPLRHASEGSLWERRRKFVRRNPWLQSVPFIVMIVGLALCSAGYGVYSAIRHHERTETMARYQELMPELSAVRTRLSVPDLDPKRREADVREAVELVSNPGIRDSILDPSSRTKLRWQFAELSTLLAHTEAELSTRTKDDSARMTSALSWNQRALEISEFDDQKWSIQQQRASFLERLDRKEEAQELRSTLASRDDLTGALHAFSEAYQRGKFREAIAILAKQNPAQLGMTGWFGRGRAHAKLGEHAEAVAAFTTAMALHPVENYRLYVHRGNSYSELRNYTEAERDLSSAIAQRADDAGLYVSRAVVRYELKKANEALADLDKVLQLEPTLTRAYFVRRQVLLQMGQRAAAEKALHEGLLQTPGDEISWVTRGVHKLARKDAIGAIADFDEALKLNSQSRLALQNKANALSEQLGKPAESIRVLDDLLKFHPESHPARAGRGVLLARQGDRTAAHRDAEEVLRRDSSAMMQYQIAGIYALTSQTHPNDVKQALSLLAKAFKSGVNPAIVKTDPDLDPIRTLPDFVRLLAAVRTIDTMGRAE
jgi:eukaryotic-like serine/threonine-protein kinase